MADEQNCPHCGKPVPPTAPGGICPECMLQAGLDTQTGRPAGAGPHGTKFIQPLPAEIAALFPQLEILECLGHGGMGVVYKARQPRLNRLIALKILTREREQDGKFTDRFTREAQALARLNHPNIVTVYDFGEAGGHCYLLMEYVDGLSLRQLLQTGSMKPGQALTIVPKICEALQYAHEQGIVHRDIKPENILLDKQGRVKIADFGIAKMLGVEGEPQNLTGAKEVMGTPHYMAPEQIEKPQEVDHRADIYSLGVVFYEMLTGELPLGKFAAPSKKVQVDVRLDEVVLRALEKEPALRYQQASQFQTRVETIASSPPAGGRSAAAPPEPPRAWPTRPGPTIGLTAAAMTTVEFYTLWVVAIVLSVGLRLRHEFILLCLVSLLSLPLFLTLNRWLLRRWYETGDAPWINWLRLLGLLAWLLAVPFFGYGVFFLQALFSERGGWHSSTPEAVLVPLTWLGMVLMPMCGLVLLRAPAPPTAAAVHRKSPASIALLVCAGLFVVGVATVLAVLIRSYHGGRSSASEASQPPVSETPVQELKPIPVEVAGLLVALKALPQSPVYANRQGDPNATVELQRELSRRIDEIKKQLQGTIAEPLVQQQSELMLQLKSGAQDHDEAMIREASDQLKIIGQQIENLIQQSASQPTDYYDSAIASTPNPEVYPVPAIPVVTVTESFTWRSTDPYVPPDFEAYFPEDRGAGRRLDALWLASDKDSRSDAEILETVRGGLRRTSGYASVVIRWLGNRYIWNRTPQNPEAIEIMYHAADFRSPNPVAGEARHWAVYFGLSVVQPKTPAILHTLADLCMQGDDPNDLDRVAWGAKSQQAELLAYVAPYRSSPDAAVRDKARLVEQIMRGETNAFAWAAEVARQRAQTNFAVELPRIRRTLMAGSSAERLATLQLISSERLTLIMDDTFVPAYARCARDEDPKVRREVAIQAGDRWVWNAKAQKAEAIDLMLRLSQDGDPDVRYNAVYYGLSTVRNKHENVVARLLEMALADHEGNPYGLFGRIEWGLRNDRETTIRLLNQYLSVADASQAQRARDIYEKMTRQKPPALPETPGGLYRESTRLADSAQLAHDLEARYGAARAISSFAARDSAMSAVARDAARAGNSDLAKKALSSMAAFPAHDAAALEAARELARSGHRTEAIEIARTITSFTQRDTALNELAR